MSFMKTLATVAAGFAAAKGMSKYKEMGGMAGLQDMMKSGGGAGGMAGGMGGMADQLGQMAEKMGIPGGAAAVKNMMNSFGGAGSAAGTEAGQAGLGGLLASMKGASAAGGKSLDDLFSAFGQNSPVSNAAEQNAKLMIRAIIQAAKADGEIDARERKMILDQLKESDPAERKFVEEQLAAPVDPVALARDTTETMAAQVYSTSLMAIRPNNQAEVAYLTQLSSALGLSKQARDEVHAAMGVPPLPA
jgi:uncharacterized membrane protein YebE (DUF533 family)